MKIKYLLLICLMMLYSVMAGGDIWNEYLQSLQQEAYISTTGGMNDTADFVKQWNITDRGSLFQPIYSDLDGSGTKFLIVWENDDQLYLYNWTLGLNTSTSNYGSPITQFVAIDKDLDDLTDFKYIAGLTQHTGASDYNLYFIDFDGINFNTIVNISLPFTPNSGLVCFDWDADVEVDCIFSDNKGTVHSYDVNATVWTDDDAGWEIFSNQTNIDDIIPTRAIAFSSDAEDYSLFFWGLDSGNNYRIIGLTATGSTIFNISNSAYSINWVKVADLDGGRPEVITVNQRSSCGGGTSTCKQLRVYDYQGTLKWTEQLGYIGNIGCKDTSVSSWGSSDHNYVTQPALYDSDGDLYPEIALISTSANYETQFCIYDSDGTAIWYYNISSVTFNVSNHNDILFVADVDNDGTKEWITDQFIWNLDDWYSYVNWSHPDTPTFYDCPIPVALGDHNWLDYVYTKDGYTIVYEGYPTLNIRRRIDAFCWNTGSPVCLGETIRYYVVSSDGFQEDNAYRMRVDCGDGTWSNWTNWGYDSSVYSECQYNQLGSFTAIAYVYDSAHTETETVASSPRPITVSAVGCFDGGDNGGCIIETNVTITGISEGGVNTSKMTGIGETVTSDFFDTSLCESWESNVVYGFCPVWILLLSMLKSIWNWVFSPWFYLALIIILIIVLIITLKGKER